MKAHEHHHMNWSDHWRREIWGMLVPRRNNTALSMFFIAYLLNCWTSEDRGGFNATHLFALQWAILRDYNIITYEGGVYLTAKSMRVQ